MDINQFAVYQLKNGPETRQMRFRSYEKLQQSGIQVRYEYYREVYLGKMQRQDTPENIRERLQKKIPKSFDGHSLSVSDVLVLNREGEITAYYVEKEGFTVIAGFIRIGSSGALLTFETTNFHIEGKAGSWLVLDTLIIDGREFFLMEHMEYGRNAAYVILDAEGKIVAEDNRNGFDENAKQQIREYLHPPKPVQKPEEKPPLENWQKYMENGEYLRSAEITEEANYNMIDGLKNNAAPKEKKNRPKESILAKLNEKKEEVARRSGQKAMQQVMGQDMERTKK